MIPASLSATSLQAADGCLSRFQAEFVQRGKGPAGSAATTGLICHETLEHFLRGTHIRKDFAWSRAELDRIFNEAYETIVGPDRNRPEYTDAYALIVKWFNAEGRKEYFDQVQIVSLEAKNNFPVPVILTDAAGTAYKHDIPVNYIMDRVDKLNDGEYKIVDYKTNWVPLTHDQLREKIQARLYALALQIIHPEAKRIWVEFDFLRHEPVEIALTKADQADTWKMLKRAAQRIVEVSEEDAIQSETINADCMWCVKKATCKALQKNVAVGGIYSMDVVAKAKRFNEINTQIKALKYLGEELQDALIKELISAQTIDLDLDEVRIKLKRSSRRKPDSRRVAEIVGPDIAAEVGTFTMAAIDELKKAGRLTSAQIAQINAATTVSMGDPGVDVSIKK
jgi:hypothetical protein